MKSEESKHIQKPDVALFQTTSHSPSYASLTNNFENAGQLKDYCIPVNSYFPTPGIMQELFKKLSYALKYYPSSNVEIAKLISEFAEIEDPHTILAGNGSTELISWLNSIFIKDDVLVPVPSFGRWTDEPKALGTTVKFLNYSDDNDQGLSPEEFVRTVRNSGVKNAILCNPNNPTGSIMSKEQVLWIMKELSYLNNFIIDESFIDFSYETPPTVKQEVVNFKNAWVLKSLGKNLGLHGLRMGYIISNPDNIQEMKKHLPYWNINGITELLLKLVVKEKEEYETSRRRVILDREYLKYAVSTISELTLFPSYANFVYVKVDDKINGDELRDSLLVNQACFVRNCGNKVNGSSQYFRIAARPKEEVDYLINALKVEIDEIKVKSLKKVSVIAA
jgi:threonine-phosphate decarboxylase